MQVRLTLLLVGLAAAPAAAQQAPTMTLDDAIAIARGRNPAYQRALADASAAGAGVLAGYGTFLPTIDANMSWSGNRSTRVTGTDDFGQSIELPDAITFRSSSVSQGISARMTVFDGLQNVNNLRAARMDVESADYTADAEWVRVEAEVRRRFLDALRTRDLIGVEETLMQSAQERLDANQRLFRVGSTSQADLLGAQVDVARQEQQVERAVGDARKARLRVLEQLGALDESLDFEPVGAFDEPFDVSALDHEAIVRRALEIHPSLAQSLAALGAAERRSSAARGRRLPSLSVNGSFGRGLQSEGYGAFFELNPRDRGWNFGMSVSLPVFTGFQTNQTIAQADAARARADETARERQLAVEQAVRSALIDLENAAQSLAIQVRATDLSRRRVELTREEFRLGSLPFTNLQQIIDQNASQERALVQARYDFAIAIVSLEEQVGERIPRPE